MSIVSFLADAAVTGKVADLGLGSRPEKVRGVLGPEGCADRKKKSLRLDYGLVEFAFYDGLCEGIFIQVHRLLNGPDEVVPDAFRLSFPGISRTVSFDAVRSDIEGRGGYYLEGLRAQTGYRHYRIAGSAVVLIVNDEPARDAEQLAAGDLWSIQISAAG
ncbi:hypothetical protein GCM10029976_018390 [Kribbella albertanoniae]|uniref:Uncharacterized protein n=1 Tax=Kribbella albertanoniae TaxID=1266829 RepID=A0A4R4P7P1_9ACTN|nr:hypothetical protein [Kribbella albertanoniae]TDC18531.1 hypothetical protein E1261_35325 [Kribbella albertanoniae]